MQHLITCTLLACEKWNGAIWLACMTGMLEYFSLKMVGDGNTINF